MNKGMDGLIDVVILVVMAAVGLFITMAAVTLLSESESTKQAEKATVISISDNPPPEPTFDTADLVVMLTNQDRFMQQPTQIAFFVPSDNSYFDKLATAYHDVTLLTTPAVETVVINDAWFSVRETKLNRLWADFLKEYTTPVTTTDLHIFPDDSTGVFQWCVVLPRR
jgi:hypothetical protein